MPPLRPPAQCKILKLNKDNKTIHKLNTHEVYNLDLVSWS